MTTTGFSASFCAEDVPSSGGAVITKKVAVTKIKVVTIESLLGLFPLVDGLLMPSEDVSLVMEFAAI